ncbi:MULTISPECIES: thioredoxin domain-containing protein [Micrococcales]|jgi:protein-disulfide isomerase|uniref:Protein-disulfide isomerase n=1 Tax=Microbacterium paraoxydans TaxID=199592 RepID=A0A1H1WBU8_9MICO|nr:MULTISPECIES: thioredoxin domain-containing protein [Micrococcales]MCK8476955.1 DsbA family protein [Microbacterium aurugineum]MCT1375917.1 DsbA family protein [Microbacterium sp. p3-SID337]MCT2223531.1 DsbA family protein [Microbacterium paraoxydans]SDS94555.1 Protein-disulfide isomerase [Microbacterium paraoxydans]
MKPAVKAGLAALAVTIVLIIVAVIVVIVNQQNTAPPESENGSSTAQVLRENSHVLDDGGDGSVTVVEFLDFECEACGAFYPVVEDLRERYDGEITYVIRYFPLPGHLNSRNAAFAAEAAAQQGRLEEMYRKLFETQAQWGEAQESRASLFRGFAEEIGLDMAAYDTAISDPATVARVDLDYNDGQALGVSGTPTFFVNGDAITLERYDDLENAILSAGKGT